MKFQITIEEIEESVEGVDKKYPNSMTVYRQTIEATTNQVIKDVVAVANGLTSK